MSDEPKPYFRYVLRTLVSNGEARLFPMDSCYSRSTAAQASAESLGNWPAFVEDMATGTVIWSNAGYRRWLEEERAIAAVLDECDIPVTSDAITTVRYLFVAKGRPFDAAAVRQALA